MASRELVFSKRARDDLRKLGVVVQKRIKLKLEFFLDSPDPLQHATSLTKPADAQYRWRVGDYRGLFDVLPDGSLVVVKVQHRRDIYKISR